MSSIDTTINNGYMGTARTEIHEVVRRLNTHLGPLLVATLAGTKDRRQPLRWAKPDGPVPKPAFENRLRMAHRVWLSLADAESDSTARAWFIGSNPRLGEDTPLTAIREDRHQEVIVALTAFLEDVYDG